MVVSTARQHEVKALGYTIANILSPRRFLGRPCKASRCCQNNMVSPTQSQSNTSSHGHLAGCLAPAAVAE